MKKRFSAAILAVIACASLPASASPTPDPAPAGGSLPQGWVRASELSASMREGAARSLRGPMSSEDLGRLVEDRLTAPRERGGSGLTSVRDLIGRGQRSDAESHLDSYGVILPGDDIDGDGAQDLYSFHFSFEEGLRLVGRKGSDGSELWSVSTSLDSYLLLFDLTGDGVDDVVELNFSVGGTVVPAVVAYVAAQSFDQSVAVYDGTDGAALWGANWSGSLTEIFAGALVAGAYVASGDNLLWSLWPEPDASGDGAPDMFVQVLDFDEIGVGSLVTSEAIYETTARGHSLSGLDGSEVALVEGGGSGIVDDMVPIPDVSGDDLADVAVLRYRQTGDPQLVAYRASGGEALWTAELGDRFVYALAPASLTAPGSVEIFVFSDVIDGDFYTLDVSAWSGADGSSLWSRFVPSYTLFEAGDADGDGGLDLHEVDWAYDEETGSVSMTLRALSGATGETLWETVFAPDGYADLLICYCSGDLTGDGARDLLSAVLVGHYDEETDEFIVESFDVTATSGSDGSALWTDEIASYEELPVALDSAGDINGNGTTDVWTTELAGTAGDYSLIVHLSEGSTNAPAWDAVRDPFGLRVYAYFFGADITGDGVGELAMGLEWYRRRRPAEFWYEMHGPGGPLYLLRLA